MEYPKVTSEIIDNLIDQVQYYVFPDTTTTVCCISLTNGFTVTGESACVSKQNFNKEMGEKLAFEQAKEKIWLLEGYLLNHNLKNK